MANIVRLKNSGTSSATPNSLEYGELAINYSDGKLFYKNSSGNIVEFAGASSESGASVTVSDTEPLAPTVGDLWFESDTGDIFVYYDGVWVDIGGSSVANIAMSDTAPDQPTNGDFWFQTSTARTFVYYVDGDSSQWVEVGATSTAAIGDDGYIQYAEGGSLAATPNFVWDDTNKRLGVNTLIPGYNLEVTGDAYISGGLIADVTGDLTGNADTADIAEQLATPRQIELTGEVIGSAVFDGTSDIQISATLTHEVLNLAELADVTAATPSDGELLQFNGSEWVASTLPTSEPMGHENRLDSTISFDAGSLTFSIAPVSGSHTVWCGGRRYVKTNTETVTIPNTPGLYYISYDGDGVLQYESTFFTWHEDTPTAYLYWNGSDYLLFDERHGITLDWATHEYLHRTRGAVLANGFGSSNYIIDGDGDLDTDAQIDIANGTFFDEDLQVSILHSATPTANTWEQVLQNGAEIPIVYLSGTTWSFDAATEYPLKQGAALATYNLLSSGTWSTPDLGNGSFGITWIVATNILNSPIIGILGQGSYSNIGQAEAVEWSDLYLEGFPVVELRPLYKVVYETKASFTNTSQSALRGVYDLRRYGSVAGEVPALPVADHGSLTGLADDDHPQYLNVSRHDAHDHSTAMSSVVIDDISNVDVSSAVAGDFIKFDGSNWVNDPINLASDTVGDYVQNLIAGTGVSVSNNSGESATPTISIGQDVSTTADVTFNTVNADLTGNVTGNADTASALQSSRTIELTGDVTGSVSFDGSTDVQISSTIQPNSVELGVDTTGQYVSILEAGTGVTIINNSGESATPNISIGQDVSTSSDVTFNDLLLTGNLTVQGSTTTLETETLQVQDNIVVLNYNQATPTLDAGIEVERGYANNASIKWDELNDKWVFSDGVNTYDLVTELGDISNVDLSSVSPSEGDILYFDGSNWVNNPLNIANAQDVSVFFAQGGQFLVYDSNTSSWVNQYVGLNDINDVDLESATPNTGDFLKYDGTNWVPDQIPEINTLNDIGNVTVVSVSTGDFLKWDGSAWVNDQIDLGTDTSGDYVESLVAGTGVTIIDNSGEGSTPNIAIGQDVATTADVTFNTVNADVTGNVTGNADTASALQTSRTIELNGDVTGSVSFDGTSDVSISATISSNSVELGADTVGDYVNSLVAGTGVTIVDNSGESATPNISIGQDVATTADVIFNTVAGTNGVVTLTTSGAPTSSADDGTLAIDTDNNILYIRSGGSWVQSSGSGGGGASVTVSDTAPSSPSVGDMWYESDTGSLLVYYDDGSSQQWIEVGGAGVQSVTISEAEPSSPSVGDLWFESDTAITYIYYDDGISSQWVEVGGSSGSVPVNISDTAPLSPSSGDLWFESDTGITYVYYDDGTSAQWIEVGGNSGSIPVNISDTAPSTPSSGALWFDSSTGTMYVYYDDGSSAQWVEVAPQFPSEVDLLKVNNTLTTASIVPDVDVTYDLGSSTKRFRDLYLSGSSIYLGGMTLSSDGSSLSMTPSDGAPADPVATESYVSTAVAESVASLVASAPSTLDTLNELAAALGDDANFATTVTNSLAGKLNLTGGTISGDLTVRNIIPQANETYDLGSSSNRFRDLYLSGSSINLGGVAITSDGSNISLNQLGRSQANVATQVGSDIDGSTTNDYHITGCAISDDGTRLAVGSTQYDGYWTNSGIIRVYEYSGGSWSELGFGMTGILFNDYYTSSYNSYSSSVRISGDGSTVAASGRSGGTDNYVTVYSWGGSDWSGAGNVIYNPLSTTAEFGHSISLSYDGSRIAIGDYSGDGRVYVYENDGSTWNLVGSIINGGTNDAFGFGVKLTSDGNTLVVAAYKDGTNVVGSLSVYDWNGTSWVQRGSTVYGEYPTINLDYEFYGHSLDISSDGNVVAVGAPGAWQYLSDTDNIGHAYVYAWDGSSWSKRGNTFVGSDNYDSFGSSVNLSSDGNRIAIGARGDDGNGLVNNGSVSVYDWNGSTWVQVIEPIYGEADSDYSGSVVGMSSDGSRLAITANGNDAGGTDIGHVRVFDIETVVDHSVRNITAKGLTVNTNTLYVDSTSNRVGIGTTTPASDLHIADTAVTVVLQDTDGTVGGSMSSMIQFTDSSGAVQSQVGLGTSTGYFLVDNNDGPMRVGTLSANNLYLRTSDANRLTIDSAGNVGIGNDTPSYALDVNGDIRSTSTVLTNKISNYNGNQLSIAGGDWGDNLHNNASGEFIWLAAEGGIVIVSSDSNSTDWAAREQIRITATGGVDNALQVFGHVYPGANNTNDLGSTSLRWRNIYTNDLHLSNGIGDYTIVEGEEDLYLKNNKTGKSFKFALIEVDESEVPATQETN